MTPSRPLLRRPRLTWAEKGVTVTRTTRCPKEQGSTLTVGGGRASFALLPRVPSWATAGFRVTGNGRAVPGAPVPGRSVEVARTWRDGDTVRISVPFRPWVGRALDDPAPQALLHGPVDLVARRPGPGPVRLGLYRDAGLPGDLLPSLTPVPDRPLHHMLDGIEPAPSAEGAEDPTRVRVRRPEPRVISGTSDSGATDPARDDGAARSTRSGPGLPSAARERWWRGCGPPWRPGCRRAGWAVPTAARR
ncbi:hypothetical protein [Streptomyces sp. YIM B13518]|uniref:hypothetical protein n=1 Tax=Streptomyces sp. YIM B13518 TaxID=3366316 RepID=UPI00369F521B